MGDFANTPRPPYYAVIFTSLRTDDDDAGYAAMAERMEQLASDQPGFLGIESARSAAGFGLTVSYWDSLQAIAGWKQHLDHLRVQEEGRRRWYQHYSIRIARVEHAYEFDRQQTA